MADAGLQAAVADGRAVRPSGTGRMAYFRPAIAALAAYQPGEQPSAGAPIVKLNTNENPYPPSPAAMEALREVDGESLRRYPQPAADEFRASVAAVLGVAADWIVAGNGSDDLLTMLFRAVADAGRPVAYPAPTYSLYRTLAQIQGAPAVEVPFDDDFNLPVAELAAADAALTLVGSPNSPSGNRMPDAALDELAGRLRGVLVIDEAYAAFAAGDALALTARRDNVIVLRTLSKSHSLAGLRLGFAVGRPALLAGLIKVKDSYNVDAVAARVGAAALRDTAWTAANVGRIRASRAALAAQLAELGYRVWPSDANFLLVRPPGGEAGAIYRQLKARGILIRYFDDPLLADRLRITVGTDSENRQLLAALAACGETGRRAGTGPAPADQ